MATQTETYKLNKPDRTDKVGISALNENMDIIEEELKKRPIGDEIPDAAFFDLDITAWTSVNFSEAFAGRFDLEEHLDGNKILEELASGRIPRVKFSGSDGRIHTIIMNVLHQYTDTNGYRTICSSNASNIYFDAYSNYSLNVLVSEGVYTVWFLAYPRLTGDSVKSVNGVMPDENGNVEVTVTEHATATLNFDNWDAEEGACYRETLEDGSSIIHAIERDASGNIISIGGIAIEGVG